MSESIYKIIRELQSQKHNIRFRQAEKILLKLGFAERKSKRGTSHRVFSHPLLMWNVTLVTHGKNDILPMYQVNDIIKAIQELQELSL